jgi:hypothetical protein
LVIVDRSGLYRGAPVKALTKADTGYLQGLYKIDSGALLRSQKDTIAFHIKQTLAGP